MGNTVMPSTALLPMDDIANVLKEQYSFSSKDDIAKDTDKVAGTDSDLIAIAATDEAGNLVADRQTVNNALNLGGTPADGFMTKVEGNKIETFGDNVSQIMSNEIAALRDELYQMRGELSRQGLINEYGIYSGFQDFFKEGDKKYYFDPTLKPNSDQPLGPSIGGIVQNSTATINVNTIYPEYWQDIQVGDYFVVHKDAQNLDFLVRATAVADGSVTFDYRGNVAGIPSTGLEVGNVELFKVLGEYNKGTFSFSHVVANALTNKEKYTMLNDDSKTIMQSIQDSNAGYAVSFNVPSMSVGALKTFSVIARSLGSPGALTCYLMEDTDVNYETIMDLDNEPVGSDQKVLAKSTPVSASKAASPTPVQIDFDFQNPIDGSYPILTNKRYCVIVVAEQANHGGDSWQIQFSEKMTSSSSTDLDVQSNNKAYIYNAGQGLSEIDTTGDLIFIMATIEVKENSETPYTEGLYTSQEIALKNSSQVARARLTMRINREGYFISADSGICPDGGTFSVVFDPKVPNGQLPNDLGIRSGDTVAIGGEVRHVTTDAKSMMLVLDKGVYIEKDAPVYRIAYKAYLRAYKKVWNPTTVQYDISNEQLLEMPLNCIMPDRIKLSNKHSDRLLFECEFRDGQGIPLDVNTFVLQIVWSTNSVSEIVNNSDLTGRIQDLTLSLDRTL